MTIPVRKKILITGGTKGIGYAVATLLAQSGYDLVLTYAGDRPAALAAAERLGNMAKIVCADISDVSSIDALEEAARPSITAVVFNAGLTYRESLEGIEQGEWERVFFANVHYPVYALQRLVPLMEKGGCVVFTGSAMGVHPHAVSLSYGVSKAAVHALTKNLVKSLAPVGIRVNAVAPGFVDTDWQKGKPAEIRQSIESKIALGRFCTPEEIADVYKMVIENQYLNGEIITVDGGYSYK